MVGDNNIVKIKSLVNVSKSHIFTRTSFEYKVLLAFKKNNRNKCKAKYVMFQEQYTNAELQHGAKKITIGNTLINSQKYKFRYNITIKEIN